MASIVNTIRENLIRWFRHVLRRDEADAVKLVKKMYVIGKNGRGRLKKRWLDVIESDMKKTGINKVKICGRLSEVEVED